MDFVKEMANLLYKKVTMIVIALCAFGKDVQKAEKKN